MEARLTRAVIFLGALLTLSASAHGASYRTDNFLCTAATPQLAKEICELAEVFRRDLAIEWLGQELPRWQQPCPIKAQVSPQMGAGGATSFMFDRGRPHNWEMVIQGSRERILDSVLPHEVTHTIFATHFGQPLPRWADEGACTTVEASSEKAKQDRMLIQFLTTSPSRGIAFNRMFAMREYPADIMPLYSQGYSVTRFLIAQGGKRKFVDYVGEGLATNNWTAATEKFYSFGSLSDLQTTWLEWVRRGSPEISPTDLPGLRGNAQLAEAASQPAAGAAAANVVASSDDGSWYGRQRGVPTHEQVASLEQSVAASEGVSGSDASSGELNWGAAVNGGQSLVPIDHAATRPQTPEQARQTILEWNSSPTRRRPTAPSDARSAAAWQPGSVRYDGGLAEGVLRR